MFEHQTLELHERLADGQDKIAELLAVLVHLQERQVSATDDLTAAVASLETAVTAAIAIHASEISQLTAEITQAAGSPAALSSLAQRINASVAKLSGAIPPAAAAAAVAAAPVADASAAQPASPAPAAPPDAGATAQAAAPAPGVAAAPAADPAAPAQPAPAAAPADPSAPAPAAPPAS
jgi:hypothetical protein